MKYGYLNGIDTPVSRLVQGTVYFTEKNVDSAFELYDTVFEAGCNTFDTAHAYGGGECERVFGRWIESRGIRDDIVILGKGAHPKHGDPTPRVTPEAIRTDIQDSLERLRTDTIDIYVLHRDDMDFPVAPIVDVLNEQKHAGHIRIFGGSNWSHQRIQQANDYAEASKQHPFTVSSPQFSLAEMVKPAWNGCISIGGHHGRAAREWYEKNQMPLFTWSSLAGGFMTGRFQRNNLQQFENYFDQIVVHAYCYEDNFLRLDRAKSLAEQKGITLPQLGLSYVLSQHLNVFAIIGSQKPSEVNMNHDALNVGLSATEITWLNLETNVEL